MAKKPAKKPAKKAVRRKVTARTPESLDSLFSDENIAVLESHLGMWNKDMTHYNAKVHAAANSIELEKADEAIEKLQELSGLSDSTTAKMFAKDIIEGIKLNQQKHDNGEEEEEETEEIDD